MAPGDTAAWTETYSTKNVGTGITLTPAGTVSDGNGGKNYSVTFVKITGGVIDARALTVTATANTKIYDVTTSAAAVPTITSGSLVSGDTAAWTETYSTKNVGTGITLTPAGTVSDGNGGKNYSVSFVNKPSGEIDARPITVAAAPNTKAYDGTTSAAAIPTITSGSLQGSDTANFTESYDTPNVGTGITLTPAGTVSDGNDGKNYSVTFVNNTSGVITQPTASLAGYVYFDGSDSGQWSASDMGMGGVTVRLFSGGSDGIWTEVTAKSPTQTKPSGAFSFTGLAAGNYQIRETTPADFLDGNDHSTGESPVGTMTQDAGQNNQWQVQLVSGQTGTGYNFALYGFQPGMISARLFLSSAPTGTQLLSELHAAPSVSLDGTTPRTATVTRRAARRS